MQHDLVVLCRYPHRACIAELITALMVLLVRDGKHHVGLVPTGQSQTITVHADRYCRRLVVQRRDAILQNHQRRCLSIACYGLYRKITSGIGRHAHVGSFKHFISFGIVGIDQMPGGLPAIGLCNRLFRHVKYIVLE